MLSPVFSIRTAFFRGAGWIWLAIVLAFALSGRSFSAEAADSSPKANSSKLSAEAIQRLIADLGSEDYRTRESATRQLTARGPDAIDALCKAAQTDDLEVSYRAVRILESLMTRGDSATQDRIAELLKHMAGRETTSAAGLATDVLALYQFTLSDRAIDNLKKLGAVVTPTEDLPLMEPGYVQVTLSDGWKGRGADLKQLKQVRNLIWLRAINVSLNDSDLEAFTDLPQVMQVDLWGTGVSAAAVEKLATALPSSTVDRRTGALARRERVAKHAQLYRERSAIGNRRRSR